MTRLRTRLAWSHIALATGVLIMAGIISTFALRGQFDQYVAASIDTRIDELARAMVSAWKGGGTWDMAAVEKHGLTALEDGFLLTLSDGDGFVVWDARTHNAGLCATMIASMADRMAGLGRYDSGSYSERTIQLSTVNRIHRLDNLEPDEVAYLVIGSWGSVYYRDADLDFIAAFNRGLLATGALVVILAALAGIISAAGLAAPVRSAAWMARSVAAGDYSPRVKISGIVELDELGSSLENMAKVLEDQDDFRRYLVIDASHEIRTPLAALRARLEAVTDGVLLPDAQLLEACLVDIQRLTELASSLEGLANVEVAAALPNCSPVDLVQLARAAVNSCAARASNSDLVIELNRTQPIMINADRNLILQVVENLLNNAIRYSEPISQTGSSSVPTRISVEPKTIRGIIRVELFLEGAEAVLAVIDYGIGIEAQHLGRIFERFYRVDPSRSRSTGGFGVGLAIVRAAARACGGEVVAFSNGLGMGSRFELRLPGVLHRRV